jgi:hypothetical protein
MGMQHTVALIQNDARERVMAETWGHLAPKKNKTYRGTMVIAVGCYGDDPLNPTVLRTDWGDLDSSPWWFGAMQDYIGDLDLEEGRVYRWEGTFRNYKFKGEYAEIPIV